jgi:hypothetical protein
LQSVLYGSSNVAQPLDDIARATRQVSFLEL